MGTATLHKIIAVAQTTASELSLLIRAADVLDELGQHRSLPIDLGPELCDRLRDVAERFRDATIHIGDRTAPSRLGGVPGKPDVIDSGIDLHDDPPSVDGPDAVTSVLADASIVGAAAGVTPSARPQHLAGEAA
jgi:hypothetical protein